VKKFLYCTSLAFLFMTFFSSDRAAAEDLSSVPEENAQLAYRPSPGRQRTITCESQRGRYAYCRTNSIGRVRLKRRLSDARCRQYDTWGADGDGSGIWVADGCRAVFVVESYRPPYAGGSWGGGRTITCKSESFEYQHCSVGRRPGRIRLERRLSDTRCIRGDNWGVDRNGVWVDRGCAAEFSVE
jgi:Protein of unknown function (DUF3011)